MCQLNSNHGLYPKQFIEELFKKAPGGIYVILERQHLDTPALIALRCWCKSKITSYFVITKNVESARKSELCKMKFTNSHRKAMSDWLVVYLQC